MPDDVKKPVLLIPHGAILDRGFDALRDPGRDGDNGGSAPAAFRAAAAENLGKWILLTTQRPRDVKRFMTYPYSTYAVEQLRDAEARKHQLKLPLDRHVRSPVLSGIINITGASIEELNDILASKETLASSVLVVRYHKEEDLYRVLLIPNPENHPAADDKHVATAWKLSALTYSPAVTNLILSHSERIMDGARELIIPGEAHFTHPQVVTLTEGKADGRSYTDFWAVPPQQHHPRGSAITLQVGDARERRSSRDLIQALMKASTPKRKDGKIPALAFDLDGTLVNARAYVWQVFLQWIDCYQPVLEAYRIPQMMNEPDDEYQARLSNPQEWHDRARESMERIRTRIADGFRPSPLDMWNTDTILTKAFGITDRIMIAHAYDYFHQLFYNPRRSLDAPPIPGIVKLVTLLQQMGFKSMYPTLRSLEDDQLPDKKSASKAALKQMGIWNQHSVLLRHEGEKLDWRNGTNDEPSKSAMVRDYLRNHPWVWVSGTADNDPKHVDGSRDFADAVHMHVEGDRPLGKEEWSIPDGVHSIRDYEAFEAEIDAWLAESKPGLDAWLVEKGGNLADKLFMAGTKIQNRIFRTADDVRKNSPSTSLLDEICDDARAVLNEISSYPKVNPMRRSFIVALNEIIASNKSALGTFEAVMEIINTYGRFSGDPSTYTIEREDGRIVNIRRRIGGSPLKEIDGPAAPIYRITSALPVEPSETFETLERIIVENAAGPDFFAINSSARYANLLADDFPRMNAVLAMVVGRLVATTGRPAHRIRATEYEPRLSGAVLTTLARLGVHTGWHGEQRRLRAHTQCQLDRLPGELHRRISYRAQTIEEVDILPDAIRRQLAIADEGAVDLDAQTDLAVWNLPQPSLTIAEMGQHVVQGGMMVVQSERYFPVENNPEWQCLTSSIVRPGEYVLPSAFLPAPALATPLHLQVWQRIG